MQMSNRGRRWRASIGLVLGVVVPVLIVTACSVDEQNSDPTRSGTAAATASSVSKTPSPTGAASTNNPGETQGNPGGAGGGDTGQAGGEQPGNPGGTDTCGATPCGTTGNPAPAPGGTDTCGGATVCGAAVWDPCWISDADITELGFRPDSRQVLSNSGGVSDKSCQWQSLTGKSEFTIASTWQTLEEFKQSGRYVDFGSLSVGGRDAYRYRAAQDTNKIGCYIGIPVQGGLVAFVTRNLKPDAPQEPCVAAQRISEALVGYVPRAM